jgi:type IX secretion system PorP/SprF family membrane protein
MKKLLPVLFLIALTYAKSAIAQQDATYSHFMYNGLAINPAYAGSAETFSATALYRHQWVGIDGAPQTQTLTMDAPFWNKKVGLGLSFINDKIGVTENLNVNGVYSYRIIFEKGTLAMGLQSGVNNYRADYNSVQTNSTNTSDDSFSQNVNRVIFNFGSGLYYYSERFFAGVSVPHIINQRLDGGPSSTGVVSRQYRHYFFTTGYVFDVAQDVKIKPSLLFKYVDGAPVQLDINTNAWYKNTYCIGFSYRTNDSFSALFQIQIAKQLRVGYAYDYIVSDLNRFNNGNHELMLRYDLPQKNSKVITPRFF